jgi:hypothetical protein
LVLLFLRILGLRTLYGISEEIYKNQPFHLLYGPGQGSTIGPFLWLLCFVLIFSSLLTTAPAIELTNVVQISRQKFVGEAFVDDAGLGTNTTPSPADHHTLIKNLQQLAQTWEKLLFSTGGALNLSECFWFLLSWEWKDGRAKLCTSITAPGNLQMTSEGELDKYITIPRIEPTSSFRTLGVHISPSGSNSGALAVLKGIVLDYCTNLRGSHLSRQDALTSYIQYLLPKLRFQPPVLSLSKQYCDKFTSQIMSVLLPKLHVNRHTARSIIFGPEKYGGLALPNVYVTANIDKLKLFLGHLRIPDRTGILIDINVKILVP